MHTTRETTASGGPAGTTPDTWQPFVARTCTGATVRLIVAADGTVIAAFGDHPGADAALTHCVNAATTITDLTAQLKAARERTHQLELEYVDLEDDRDRLRDSIRECRGHANGTP